MDTAAIIEELEAERDRLDQAITALRGKGRGLGRPAKGSKRTLSAAARKRISQAEEAVGREEEGGVTIILFTTVAPSVLGTDFSRAGFSVYEALAISEVLALAAENVGAQIVIAAEVESERAKVIQGRQPTLHLKPNATAADVIWELEQVSPRSTVAH